MSECHNYQQMQSRREFLARAGMGLGAFALGSLLHSGTAVPPAAVSVVGGGVLGRPHFAPRAKRVIYLFMSGGPSQQDLFDYKPLLRKLHGQELPTSVRQGQRLTGMTAGQGALPLAGSALSFKQYGQSGAWISEAMPYLGQIADELCWIKSMHTDAINHDPATTFFQTGSPFPGRPSVGSWLSYGLGSENANLPAYCVLLSKGDYGGAQPLYARVWGNGFLPSEHQGVQFRSGKDPVLYLNNPPGVDAPARRRQLDHLRALQEQQLAKEKDPEIAARIAQYEMAYRMQTSVPEIMDTSEEPDYIYDLYGPDSRRPGTYAANCLLARRLAEKDVRFIQLFHRGWDAHGNAPGNVRGRGKETDQPTAALIMDLKQRGLLEDTLVVWGGEFGRTAYSQGKLSATNYGRDHHPNCFTIFMAGGGVKAGLIYGETDDFSYNIVRDPVHVHDFQATLLHLLGIDHERLTFKHQGRRYRLTDVHGEVVRGVLG